MFWMMLLFVAGLAGLAFGWIEVGKTAQRITISFELAKITPALARAKAAVLSMFHGAKHQRERYGQHS